jgi:hypothetical protein
MKSVSFRLATASSSRSGPLLSPEEVQASWYSPKELADILTDCQAIIDSEDVSNEAVHVRGLEIMVARGRETHQLLNEVISDILEEQERLKQTKVDGEKKTEILAEIERRHSQQRLRIAHLRALQDAQVVQGTVPVPPARLSSMDRSQIRQKRRSERQLRRQSALVIAE